MRFLYLTRVLAVLALCGVSSISSASDVDVSSLVQRLQSLPLRGGRATLALRGDTISGRVSSGNCTYQITDLETSSSTTHLLQPGINFVFIYAHASSSCLPDGPERFYIDMQVLDDGRVSTVSMYSRSGNTNTYLATCGRIATLTSTGANCE